MIPALTNKIPAATDSRGAPPVPGNVLAPAHGLAETLEIRDAQLQKIPYMLVVGNKEERANGVSVRLRTNEDLGMTDLPDFMDHLNWVVEAKNGL